MEYYDITVRYVPNYGWLPIIFVVGKERFRGSFYKTREQAFAVAAAYNVEGEYA